MRRYVVATAMAIGAMLAPTAAAQTPSQDSVTGSGSTGDSAISALFFEIDAHSGPSGENPTGSAQFRTQLTGDFGGAITCLAVRENVATFNFIRPTFVITVQVTDLPAGDQIRIEGDVRAPADCTALTVTGGRALVSGDLVVVDAEPFPTSKAQCKDGGWKAFGVFKNQGGCVSFVATGGKNPPAGSTTP